MAMRFLRRGRDEAPGGSEPEAPDSPAKPGGSDPEAAALEALAGVLRIWGELAFDLDDTAASVLAEQFEGWARHALVAGPRPGLDDPESGDLGRSRDWVGLQRFVREQRGGEQEWVTRSVGDLRQVIWIFVQSLGRALREDRRSDRIMTEHVHRLQEAAESGDTTTLKEEALSCAELIENVLSDGRARQQAQLADLSEQIDEMTTELIEVKEQLGSDSLTGIHNRAALDEHLEKVVGFRDVLGTPATVYMVDVDHFKWVNDKFGHADGDQVIQGVARCLKRSFRRKRDFVARYGGDEFTVMITDDKPELVELLGERLLQEVRDLTVEGESEEHPIRVSVSVGAASLGPDEDGAAWLMRADRALYQAKQAGRDRLAVAPPPGADPRTETGSADEAEPEEPAAGSS